MTINIAIIQPHGYVHSLVFLDVARAMRHGLRCIGISAHISKNRLRSDCTNWILGGHLALRPDLLEGYRCVVVNLEQMGTAGAALPAEYRHLLKIHPVLDYDPQNLATYQIPGLPTGVFEFSHGPYLVPSAIPLQDREIDLLFYGSVNERRRELFGRIEAAGVSVTYFDNPIYAEERDHFIRNAKAVLNCSFYEAYRFEQVRAFHCLSLGTPVICERILDQHIPSRFQDSCFFFDPAEAATFFSRFFRSGAYIADAESRLSRWRDSRPGDDSELRRFVAETERWLDAKHTGLREPWRPTRINLGSGQDYRQGWLNIDVDSSMQPDLVLDHSRPLQLPICLRSELGGEIELVPSSVEEVCAENVLEHVHDLPRLMTQVLGLLRPGGRLVVEVPCDGALKVSQGPTQPRVFNPDSWFSYTDRFWSVGWFNHRFRVDTLDFKDHQMRACDHLSAAAMRVVLEKIETTPWERTVARTMQLNFGGIPEDR